MTNNFNVEALVFDAQGLIPAVVQSPQGEVRMMAWMNREAVQRTLDSGLVTFWSRSRKALWTKGETSGNRLRLRSLHPDCDGDTLLVLAEPEGPSCHRGTESCFDAGLASLPWLGQLEALLRERRAGATLQGSYTQKLFAQGVDRIGKKVVEEAGEVILAAKNLESSAAPANRQAFLEEAADLLFHLDLLLLSQGQSLVDVAEVLRRRHEGLKAEGDRSLAGSLCVPPSPSCGMSGQSPAAPAAALGRGSDAISEPEGREGR